MSCSQAFEIDLMGFLADPRSASFDAFRAHYPRCENCAAEVSAWTELHAELAAQTHPAPDALARYDELAANERAVIDRHTEACAPCREELRLLAAFDPARLAAPVVAAPAPREREGWMQTLAGILWHPGFAYGLALLLVLPILWRTQGPGRFAERPNAAPLDVVAELSERQAKGMQVPSEEVPRLMAEKRLAPPRVADPKSERLAARPYVAEPDRGADLHAEAMQKPAPPGDFAAHNSLRERASSDSPAEELVMAQRRKSAAVVDAEPETELRALASSAAIAKASDSRADEFAELQAFGFAAPAPPPLRSLAPIALASAPVQVTLRVPVPAGERRDVEVVLSETAGARRLERSGEARAAEGFIGVEVPRDWLLPGEYRVELRDGAAPPSVFSLSVVAR